MTKLKVNKCKCLYCLDIIESKHRHDFVKCRCGAIFTDGGLEYIRRGYGKPCDMSWTIKTYDENFFPILHLEN